MSPAILLAICIGVSSPVATLAINHVHTGNSRVQVNSKGSLLSRSATGIINGTEVKDESGKYSYFAMPTSSSDSNEWGGCGASIISPTWGLTAAHCFGGGSSPCEKQGQEIKLWMGDIHLSEFGMLSGLEGGNLKHTSVRAKIHCHPKFNGKCSNGHDMTLLQLLDPLPEWVKPVPINLQQPGVNVLLKGSNDKGAQSVGEVTTNIGFGYREKANEKEVISSIAPAMMREADLTIFADDYKACASVYAGGYGCSDDASTGKATNLDQQLCAGDNSGSDRDTCSGDSGSPMLNQHGVQIGVVSYGGGPGEKMSGPGRICADPDYMGVYTRVSAFREFILSHVKDLPTV